MNLEQLYLLILHLTNSKKFNRGSLRKQKYNLINEIKNHYDLDTFFSAKIKNYKELAALYTLIEGINSVDSTDTNQLVNNKITLLEYLTKQEVSTEQKDIVLEEFSTYDKDTRILTYKILLERFNDKYENLTSEQKQVLKEFIESVESTPGLRNFYNSKINELKNTLAENSKNIKDKVTKIKINEISKFLVELDKTDKVGDDNLLICYNIMN